MGWQSTRPEDNRRSVRVRVDQGDTPIRINTSTYRWGNLDRVSESVFRRLDHGDVDEGQDHSNPSRIPLYGRIS